MGRRIVCLVVLLVMAFPCWTLRSEEVSESTRLMETIGTPYPPQESYSYPDGGAIAIDLAMGRPLGFAAMVLGAGLALIAMPFALASHTTGPVYERLVVEPYMFTVCRPLGEF